MTDLEVFRLSAEACGKVVATDATGGSGILIHGPFVPVLIDWNPFINVEQRWQCVEKLLAMGEEIVLNKDGGGLRPDEDCVCQIRIECLASEFPARALAELHRRSKEG